MKTGLLFPWESVLEPRLRYLAGFPGFCHLLSTHPSVVLSPTSHLPFFVLEQPRKQEMQAVNKCAVCLICSLRQLISCCGKWWLPEATHEVTLSLWSKTSLLLNRPPQPHFLIPRECGNWGYYSAQTVPQAGSVLVYLLHLWLSNGKRPHPQFAFSVATCSALCWAPDSRNHPGSNPVNLIPLKVRRPGDYHHTAGQFPQVTHATCLLSGLHWPAVQGGSQKESDISGAFKE